jgi:hypothetical protein
MSVHDTISGCEQVQQRGTSSDDLIGAGDVREQLSNPMGSN